MSVMVVQLRRENDLKKLKRAEEEKESVAGVYMWKVSFMQNMK